MHTLGDRSLFFLHIPKTAGTSLRELLSCRFAPADILALSGATRARQRAQQLADVAQYRFVHGHVPYALVDRFPRRPFVVTLLRDPLDRAVSAFYDMQRQARMLAPSPMPGWAVPRGRATTPRRPGCRSPNSSATRRLPRPATLATSRCRFWPPAT